MGDDPVRHSLMDASYMAIQSPTAIIDAFFDEYAQMMALAQDLDGDVLPEKAWCVAVLESWVSRRSPLERMH